MYIILLLKEKEISANAIFCSRIQSPVAPVSKIKSNIFLIF